MKLEDKATIATMIAAIVAKGWPNAQAKSDVRLGSGGWVVESTTYKSTSGWNPDVSIYCNGVGIGEDVLDRFPSPESHALKQALETLALAQTLASNLGVSAELLAPLSAVAAAMTSNLLAAPIRHEAECGIF